MACGFLLAPLVVSSLGPRPACMPSIGERGIERLQRASRLCGYKMAVDGSRWQFLGRAPIRPAPRHAIDVSSDRPRYLDPCATEAPIVSWAEEG